MAASDTVFPFQRYPFLSGLPEVSRPRWGGVLLGVGEDRQRCVFSCASLRGDACLCPHPKVSSSYMSHSATCKYEKKRSGLPCACCVVFLCFFSFFFFFFLCLGLKRRDTQEGEGRSRQLQSPTERVGLVTAERGIVPLV